MVSVPGLSLRDGLCKQHAGRYVIDIHIYIYIYIYIQHSLAVLVCRSLLEKESPLNSLSISHRMYYLSIKEWDDPSVVPGRETYEDWTYIKGLDVTGGDTFFPHMEDQWQDMVKRQTKNLVESGISTQTSSVRCIRDDDSYVVDGRQQYTTKLPSPIRNE